MRFILALTALLSASAAQAESAVAIDSSIFIEHSAGEAGQRIEPANRLARGDRIVTVLRWNAPSYGTYTATSAVPHGISLQATSRTGVEFSTDGGRTWHRLSDAKILPRGITHLRWQLGRGAGSLTYRAVVL